MEADPEIRLDPPLEPAPKRKRGRPPGSKNKPKLARPILTPPSSEPSADYKHADIDTIVARQLSLLDWAQQACRNEMTRAYQGKGLSISIEDITRLEKLSNSIVRAVDALKKSSDLAEEIAKRLSPEQLLRAAIDKVKAQDRATLKSAIRELREYLAKLGPVTPQDRMGLGEVRPAAQAIASLEDEED